MKRRGFYFRAKRAGAAVELYLGPWPAVTVEAARAKVRGDRGSKGIAADPAAAAEARRAQREAQTLADAWAALEANPTRRRDGAPLRPATWRSYVSAWDHLRPYMGARLMTDISGEAVASLRGTLLRKVGPAQTRRALALLVVLLGGRMPRDANGRTIQKPSIEPRRRFMDAAELGALLRGLDAEPMLWRVFWMCCLLAPLRRGNLARARWSDLNLDRPARWTVAADEAKGRKLLAMPIAEPLARILRDWRAQNPAEWVFPRGLTAGRKTDDDGPVVSVQHAWARALLLAEAVRLCDAIAPREGMDGRRRFAAFLASLDRLRLDSWAGRGQDRKREGSPLVRGVALLRDAARSLGVDPEPLALRDLTPHDLRRTAASWAVQSGASLAVVAASLGHADTRVTEAHYGHLSDDPVRRMLADNAGRLLATVEEQRSPAKNAEKPV
ncbi:MAG: tyrosine-type recombinase/integrase [Planctomycetes bacterium]|nr:tyrosine-type recombinase/integrase [Planctomycetota bacterium]